MVGNKIGGFMKYEEKRADVTKLDKSYVICHCISTDCAMGAGVVVPIKKKHINVKPACVEYTREMTRQKSLGTSFRYEDEKGVCYNMFSKFSVRDNAYNLPNGEYLRNLKSCLHDLRNQMVFRGEEKLAMPKIGSGLDRCNWEDVKEAVKDIFSDTNIEILVCLWD